MTPCIYKIYEDRHITLGRTPLDEWSALCRDLYLTTHITHYRQTSVPTAGFDSKIAASKRPKTHASARTATWIGSYIYTVSFYVLLSPACFGSDWAIVREIRFKGLYLIYVCIFSVANAVWRDTRVTFLNENVYSNIVYSVIKKDGLNFVRLYFLNYTRSTHDLRNIWKRRS